MRKIYWLIFILTASLGLAGCSFEAAPSGGMALVNYQADGATVKIKELGIDKQTYHSQENLTVNLFLTSGPTPQKILLAVSGLKDNNGVNYLSQKKEINLPQSEPLSFTFTLPEYSGCSGFPAGEYELQVVAYQDNDVLDQNQIKFNFQP